MPTYLYCLLIPAGGPDAGPAAVRGIAGAAVRVLSAGSLEAWVSTVPAPPPAATAQTVREHDGVVSAALATGRTPLPARFGQIWASDEACATAVTQRNAELEPLLRRVAGLVEMTVCTLLPGMPPAPLRRADDTGETTPGRAYLRRLRARADRERRLRAALEALRARVSRALGPVSRGEVAEIRGSDEVLSLSVSYLVERGQEDDFRRAVNEVSREAAARLVVAGPRAPYSFAPPARSTRRATEARPADRS
ncbi:MAG: GvpL/GvpF family gas vesicle protein [Gemmatimonadaceae bacterium]